MRSGNQEERDADDGSAEHPDLAQKNEVTDAGGRQRAGNQDVPGREDRPGAERHRRERKPEQHASRTSA